MKSTIIFIVALSFIIYSAGGMKISFKPFSITFTTPYELIGIIFLVIGIAFMKYQLHKNSYSEGFKDGVTELATEIKNEIDKKQPNANNN